MAVVLFYFVFIILCTYDGNFHEYLKRNTQQQQQQETEKNIIIASPFNSEQQLQLKLG